MEKHMCYRRQIEGNLNEDLKNVEVDNKKPEKQKRTVSFTTTDKNEIFNNIAFDSIRTESKES
jgi:hypothetical protein